MRTDGRGGQRGLLARRLFATSRRCARDLRTLDVTVHAPMIRPPRPPCLPRPGLLVLAWLTLAVALGAAPVRAASAPADDSADGALRLHAFTLRHQPAGEAVALVAPLLSKRGTVELQPGTNTLLVRDVLSAITRIVPVLAAFDHPARAVTLDLQLIEASAATASGGGGRLPAELLVRLRKLLPYKGYAPVAGAEFATQEGEEVTYDLAGRFRVAFRVGSLVDGRRLRIHGFSIQRLPDTGDELIHTNLNLSLGQSMVLVLAREEDSPRALMVALEARLGVAPISPPSGAP